MGVTLAVVQRAPAVLDLRESLRRAAAGIAEAAEAGAALVAFAETWLPGYPAWVFGLAGWDDPTARHWHARLLHESPVLGGADDLDDDLAPIRQAAREHAVTVVIGMNERPTRTAGSLFNSLVTVGPDGTLLNVHRKLTPTHTERIVWAPGDAAGLRTVDTPAGRVGGLICWEHFLPLARAELHAQDEQLHVAAWPDATEMHLVAARNYAFEGRCVVVSAGLFLRATDVPDELESSFRVGLGADAREGELLFDGGSAIIGPDGEWIVPPLRGEEGIVCATVDFDELVGYRLDLDLAGHYSRPDVFELKVNRTRR